MDRLDADAHRAHCGAYSKDWQDWRWQLRNRISDPAALDERLTLTDGERTAWERQGSEFGVAVTPYYASLIHPRDRECPIRRQCIPTPSELEVAEDEHCDPLAEDEHTVAPGLTHRYPDRAMLYTTHVCPVHCRHCNRRRKVGRKGTAPTLRLLQEALLYLEQHSQIRDVLVSGGDPLCLSNARLERLLKALRCIEHLEIIRIATRAPVTLPQRVTPELCAILTRFPPLYVVTHFNHPRECTAEAAVALERLAAAGCVLANQMVLLKGVNDEAEVVRKLNHWLLRHRCRPYYIFQCDSAQGIGHFKTSVARGIEIIRALRGHTSGLAVPHYVVDLPGGGGKVPLQPEYLVDRCSHELRFHNYVGESFTYVDR